MRIFATAVAVSFGLALAAPAEAQTTKRVTVESIVTTPQSKPEYVFNFAYITGVINAFVVANAYREARNEQKAYCAPPRLALNGDMALEMLSQWLNAASPGPERSARAVMNPEVGLHFALQYLFPCG
jgi:hypothetical protein